MEADTLTPARSTAPELAGVLHTVRRRARQIALGAGLLAVLPALFAWLAVSLPADFLFALPRSARALLLLAGTSGAAAAAWFAGLREWLRPLGDDAIALRIERALPDFRSRMIAGVQLSRETSGTLVDALVKETANIARNAPLHEAAPTTRAVRMAKFAAAAVATTAAGLWLSGHAAVPLLKRAVLIEVPVPRKTQIVSFTGERVIAVGDDVKIEAIAAGAIPGGGRLWIHPAAGKKQELPMAALAEKPGVFSRSLLSVQEGFRYWIELGDNRTAAASVRVRPRPVITKTHIEQRWPAYTGLAPQVRSGGDMKLLAGSKLAISLHAGTGLRAAAVRFLGADKKSIVRETALLPARLEPGKIVPLTEWSGTASLMSADVGGMQFFLRDEEGVESRGMAVHRIEVMPDQPPALRVVWPPRREELVTTRAVLLVSFEAKDDYGIGEVKLHFTINGARATAIELDLEGAGAQREKSITRRFEWQLPRLGLQEGDIVEYWFEAADNNDITGPGRTVLAEHYQARVVSDEEKRADLAIRLDETLRGIEGLRSNQQDLATRLGELIQAK